MKEKRDMALSLLDNIIIDYFRGGKMTVDTAYSMTVLAKAYVQESLGEDQHNHLITKFEEANYETPIIFLNNASLKKQIRGLKELKSMLSNAPDTARDVMIFINEGAVKSSEKQRGQER